MRVESVAEDRGNTVEDQASTFDEIVAAHRALVYGVARRLLGSHHDADEATQRTFVRAWRALGGFRGESALRTWLVRIVINVASTMRSRPAREVGDEQLTRFRDPAEDSETRLGRRQDRRMIRRAVAELPPRQREVVVLKVFSEMTYAEVASVMGISEGAVKAHLHQAVGNLRRRLAEGRGED